VRPRREPHREGLSKILIGMLLRVPPWHVTNELPRERHRLVLVAVWTAGRSEQFAPLPSLVELVGVVVSMPRLLTQVHYDLARVLEMVHLFFQVLQLGFRKIKRNADDRLLRRTSPLIA